MLDSLQEKFDLLSSGERTDFTLRMRRALSWIGCAEQRPDDPDARFIFYWIAFNALHGRQNLVNAEETERNITHSYIERVVDIDPLGLYRSISDELTPEEIDALVENVYVLAPFWASGNWKRALDTDAEKVYRALVWGNAREILAIVFDRLYVLRNQLVHGGATWGGSLNRGQVVAGERFISFLLPRIADAMMTEPNRDWGTPYYPPTNM